MPEDVATALQPWERAKETVRQLDIPCEGMILHHDQGSAFISYAWTGQLLLKDGVRLAYALRGFKDNPEMESFFSRFKEEVLSLLFDARSITELATRSTAGWLATTPTGDVLASATCRL